MEKATYSIDFSPKIKQAKADGASYDVICSHCGATAAKLIHESCGDGYEEPVKYSGEPEEEKKKKAFQASGGDPHEYKRDLPKYFPEVNHGTPIICPNCGNIAARVYPIRENMYAKD